MFVLFLFATLVAYFPSLQGDFLWDDAGHVTNPELQSWSGLLRIWFEPGVTQQYYPLLHSAFWLEHRLWGDTTLGYHLVNVLWHATAACLFVALLRRLAVPGALLAGLFFALHPVCVESVAWISEQKNTLSTVFYLAAALAWTRFEEERRPRHYAIATVWFFAALLTKTVTATLPAALLVVAWWRRGRLSWRADLLPLLPWFAAGVIAGLFTAWFERTGIGAQGSDFDLSLVERGMLAGRAVWFYFGKLLWPAELIFIYPRWTIDAAHVWQWVFPLTALAGLMLLWRRRRENRGLLAGALFFVGTLFPALGFVNVFPFIYSFVADHFQYVACLGILTLAAAGATTLAARLPTWAARIAAASVLTTLGLLTWRQAHTYRDVFALYTKTIAGNPECWMAHNNLAIALVDAGRPAEAIPHYERAIALRPRYAEAENNLGYALTKLGRHLDAIPHLERAIRWRPTYGEAHNNLGTALMGSGKSAEGIAAFTTATQTSPGYAIAHFNLGLALASTGKPADAIPHFRRALQLQPQYADAELNWGIALTVTGRVNEGIPHFERAIQLNPNQPHAHNSFGRALAAAGRLDEAIARFRQALELQPNYAEAHYNLALALRQVGRVTEAEEHLRTAQQLGMR